MYPNGLSSFPTPVNLGTPQSVFGNIADAKENVLKILQESFKVVGTVKTDPAAPTGNVSSEEIIELEAPLSSRNVNDITLRIGLLQDALNQLMAKVSKTEIQRRMDESQKENQKQLEKFKDQMEKAAEAAEKNKEAQKKGGLFEAIGNWIQAIVSVVSAIITLASAVGQILTNPAGAAGLIVASLALIGTAAVQITLAIDATMRAAGKEGFLSESQKKDMAKAAEIMGYIALAGSMIGLIGGVVVALGQAGKAAATLTAKEVTKAAAAKMVGSGMKEIGKKSMDMTVNRVAMYAFKDSIAQLTKHVGAAGIVRAVGQGTVGVVSGAGTLAVNDIKQDASELLEEADLAEAAAKAIEALIAKLQALIEQLQEELEHLIEQGQETMAIIFGAIEETADATDRVYQAVTQA